MSIAARAAAKRPYLRAGARRDALLVAAADLVTQRGWAALSMASLSTSAGVSRQLVYRHFPDAPALLAAVMHSLFDRSRVATARALRAADDDVGRAIRDAFQVFLDLPRAQRQALRALSGDWGPQLPELQRARRLVRDEILRLWVPYARRRSGLDEARARALTWMLISAAWGLTELIEEGSLSASAASALLAGVAERALGAAAPPRRPSSTLRPMPRRASVPTRSRASASPQGERR